MFASIANSRFQRGFYNLFWLSSCLRAYRIRVPNGDSILFSGFRAVCEHSEFVFLTGILYCVLASVLFASIANSSFRWEFHNVFLAFELFASIANSRFQRGFHNVF